ncbi:hypothetical protein [Roseospirillum parvum]|uniref:Uncharacterized protein n=1 Tax=Roseospirillum parvum TaxID=83401 RepID=A0A1G8E686_9PROT|nr:hypothetical protein [Roseospirillum parvum]SDH65413.1 hypothetical protein SAMN05421742_10949 [Roseospirillum parvum]
MEHSERTTKKQLAASVREAVALAERDPHARPYEVWDAALWDLARLDQLPKEPLAMARWRVGETNRRGRVLKAAMAACERANSTAPQPAPAMAG